ncbi:conserved hypothetical protein [Corynebacterium efficiens YS-314]|uniref:Uncharacterized protein n=1 Tax=Corynebacterium efficiens (strain DSM 44549 / YS-314 / AJ 12310 / JCM 11189 / NBRC 100395) TaxID=196164 RepID=Q8FPT4_COREF|nr:conserved hypothetical protein [Corynebacterium efficiens YS-314]
MVRVKYCPVQGASRACRVLNRVLDETGTHVVRKRVADQTPGTDVDDRGQVHEFSFPAGQVGDVADIELVAVLGGEVSADEVVEDPRVLVRDGGAFLLAQVHPGDLVLAHETFDAFVVDPRGRGVVDFGGHAAHSDRGVELLVVVPHLGHQHLIGVLALPAGRLAVPPLVKA